MIGCPGVSVLCASGNRLLVLRSVAGSTGQTDVAEIAASRAITVDLAGLAGPAESTSPLPSGHAALVTDSRGTSVNAVNAWSDSERKC
jgi:hypothetical protein